MGKKFNDYNASQIVPQGTLLMKFNKVIEYLKNYGDNVITGISYENGYLNFTFSDETVISVECPSVNSAYIENGHLIIEYTNGETIDTGNLKPVDRFEIDEYQHLIVYFTDGTNQDLGAIFDGNVNINGSLQADLILEKMSGYSFASPGADTDGTTTIIYASAVKTGNKLTTVIFGTYAVINTSSLYKNVGAIRVPKSIGNKIYPFTSGSQENLVSVKFVDLTDAASPDTMKEQKSTIRKFSYTDYDSLTHYLAVNGLTAEHTYLFRIETTFLLSDNLAPTGE